MTGSAIAPIWRKIGQPASQVDADGLTDRLRLALHTAGLGPGAQQERAAAQEGIVQRTERRLRTGSREIRLTARQPHRLPRSQLDQRLTEPRMLLHEFQITAFIR